MGGAGCLFRYVDGRGVCGSLGIWMVDVCRTWEHAKVTVIFTLPLARGVNFFTFFFFFFFFYIPSDLREKKASTKE